MDRDDVVELDVNSLLGVLDVDVRLMASWTAAIADKEGDQIAPTARRLTERAAEAKQWLHDELERTESRGPFEVHLPRTRLELVAAMVDINRAFAAVYEAVAEGVSGDLRSALLAAAEAERTQAAVLATHLPPRE